MQSAGAAQQFFCGCAGEGCWRGFALAPGGLFAMQMGPRAWRLSFCVCEARVFSARILDLCLLFYGSTGHCRSPMQRKRRIIFVPSV